MNSEVEKDFPARGSRLDVRLAPDDDEVVERVRAGDRLLFEVLMRRHNRTVFRAAEAILRSDDEAEDVMQHAYVRAFEHLGEYEGRSRFSTWLTRIAIYEAFARLRRRERVALLEDSAEGGAAMVDTQANPEQRVGDAELKVITEAAIDDLPQDFRIVFVLRAVEQMSVADVATALGDPRGHGKNPLFPRAPAPPASRCSSGSTRPRSERSSSTSIAATGS